MHWFLYSCSCSCIQRTPHRGFTHCKLRVSGVRPSVTNWFKNWIFNFEIRFWYGIKVRFGNFDSITRIDTLQISHPSPLFTSYWSTRYAISSSQKFDFCIRLWGSILLTVSHISDPLSLLFAISLKAYSPNWTQLSVQNYSSLKIWFLLFHDIYLLFMSISSKLQNLCCSCLTIPLLHVCFPRLRSIGGPLSITCVFEWNLG